MGSLDGWTYCPRCRAPLERGSRRVECPECGFVAYANAAPTACAVCVDDRGRILLVRRAAEVFHGYWDLPGGFVEEDEHPLDTVRRELLEETGYTGGEWESLGAVASSPSLKDNRAYLFLARGVEETTTPDPDEHELVEVVRVPVNELLALVRSGKIVSSSGVAAIMLALERLREDP